MPFSLPKLITAVLFLASVYIFSWPAKADSWASPQQETVYSPDGNTRLIITPRDLDNALAYYEDKVANKDNPGLPENSRRTKAFAVVETKSEDGAWSVQWQTFLINELAPVSAFIANDAKHFVTFDNWGSTGYGNDVIAVYNEEKQLLWNHSLEDILPDFYLNALWRTVSSRYWMAGDPVITDKGFEIGIAVPKAGAYLYEKDNTVTFRFAWNDPRYEIVDPVQWVEAQIKAASIAQDQLASTKKQLKSLISPLKLKPNMTEREWQMSLREIFSRLAPNEGVAATKHLRSKDHAEYKISETWIIDEFDQIRKFSKLKDPNYTSNVIIGTNDQGNLIALLNDIAKNSKENDFRTGHLFLVLNKQYWVEIEKVFAESGLELTFIDPKEPIPPSLEQLDKRYNYRPEDDPLFGFLDELDELDETEK